VSRVDVNPVAPQTDAGTLARTSDLVRGKPDSRWHPGAVSDSAADAELELVAAALASGQTHAQVAETVGLSLRTTYRRAAHPEVQALIAEHRREAARQIRDAVVEVAKAGLQRLHDTITDPDSPAGAAVSASKYVVDLAIGPGGLGALVDPPGDGEACQACGHTSPDPAERAEAAERMRARLAEMGRNLHALPPAKPELGDSTSAA